MAKYSPLARKMRVTLIAHNLMLYDESYLTTKVELKLSKYVTERIYLFEKVYSVASFLPVNFII